MSDVDEELREYLREAVTLEVRAGFRSEDDILEWVKERVDDELGEPDAVLVEELRRHARKLLQVQRGEEAQWAERTTNDNIDAAFEALNEAGMVALQNAGYTMSDGWEDVHEVASHTVLRPRGAAFYHGQDLERGVAGSGLMLAFGAFVRGAEHKAASLAVARQVCDVLAQHGVTTKWNGKIATRIEIPPFEWRKRRTTKAPAR